MVPHTFLFFWQDFATTRGEAQDFSRIIASSHAAANILNNALVQLRVLLHSKEALGKGDALYGNRNVMLLTATVRETFIFTRNCVLVPDLEVLFLQASLG